MPNVIRLASGRAKTQTQLFSLPKRGALDHRLELLVVGVEASHSSLYPFQAHSAQHTVRVQETHTNG